MAEAVAGLAAALGTSGATTGAATGAATGATAGATAGTVGAGATGALGAAGATGAGTAGTLGAAGTAGTGLGAAGVAGDAATGLSALAGEGATVAGSTPLAGEAATLSLTPEALTASNGLSVLEGTGLPATEGGLGAVTPAAEPSSLLSTTTPAGNLAATQSELYAPQLSSSLTSGLGPTSADTPSFGAQLSSHLNKYGMLYSAGAQGGEKLYESLTAKSGLPQLSLPNVPQTPQVPYPRGGGADKFAWMRAFGVQG